MSDPFPSSQVIDTVGEAVPSSASGAPSQGVPPAAPVAAAGVEPSSALAPGRSADQASFPPIDLDTGFFDTPLSAESSLEIDIRDPRLHRKATALAAKRRAQLTKYVTVAVALSTALCMAALVKAATSHGHGAEGREPGSASTLAAAVRPPDDPVNAAAPTVAAASPPAPILAVAAPPPPPEAPAGSAGSAEESARAPGASPADPGPSSAVAAAAGPSAEPAPQPAAAAPAPEASAAPLQAGSPSPAPAPAPGAPGAAPQPESVAIAAPTPPALPAAPAGPKSARGDAPPAVALADSTLGHEGDARSASREKDRSRAALEAGRFGDSIVAGERSVTLDPADAEAWLILGAAYQSRGAMKDAMRCFQSCLDRASRGPKGECAAMVRQR